MVRGDGVRVAAYRALPRRPRDAARRGLREEVGLDLDVAPSSQAEANPDLQSVTFVHRVDVTAEQAATASPVSPEIVELTWAAPEALPPLYKPIERTLRMVRLP